MTWDQGLGLIVILVVFYLFAGMIWTANIASDSPAPKDMPLGAFIFAIFMFTVFWPLFHLTDRYRPPTDKEDQYRYRRRY